MTDEPHTLPGEPSTRDRHIEIARNLASTRNVPAGDTTDRAFAAMTDMELHEMCVKLAAMDEPQSWYDVVIPDKAPVAEWTLLQCSAYVDGCEEIHAECAAEAGSGAMSLGYGQEGAYAAANAVPQPSEDAKYNEARKRLADESPVPASAYIPAESTHDDIPF